MSTTSGQQQPNTPPTTGKRGTTNAPSMLVAVGGALVLALVVVDARNYWLLVVLAPVVRKQIFGRKTPNQDALYLTKPLKDA